MRSDEIRIGDANEFTADEIKTFKGIVRKAAEVNINNFDWLIRNNPILLMCPSSAHIEAIGALKIPRDDYKQAQSEFNPSEFTHELG
jgi:hypothetical protein